MSSHPQNPSPTPPKTIVPSRQGQGALPRSSVVPLGTLLGGESGGAELAFWGGAYLGLSKDVQRLEGGRCGCAG